MAVPEERAAVILATDTSGSMEARDVPPSRMTAVRRAALQLLDDAPEELRVGAVAFNHSVRAIEPPRADRRDVRDLIAGLRPRRRHGHRRGPRRRGRSAQPRGRSATASALPPR